MKIDNEALMFFHSELNKKLFNGELETAIVCMCPGIDCNEEGIEATTEAGLDPFIIWFRRDISNDNPVYVLTILLHEMVHQYCIENEIEDVGGSFGSVFDMEEHTPYFFEAAKEHGMDKNGYSLTKETENIINNIVNRYFAVREIKEDLVKRDIEEGMSWL